MFEVQWRPEAQNDLAEVWMAADSPGRQAITAAVRRIDELLQSDPLDTGEGREETYRIHFQAPLVVIFQLFPAERRVLVEKIGLMARRRS
jgi:hypothetical protein